MGNSHRDLMEKKWQVTLKRQGLVIGPKMSWVVHIYNKICKRVETVRSNNLRRGYKAYWTSNYSVLR